jgi:hypothetical protein
MRSKQRSFVPVRSIGALILLGMVACAASGCFPVYEGYGYGDGYPSYGYAPYWGWGGWGYPGFGIHHPWEGHHDGGHHREFYHGDGGGTVPPGGGGGGGAVHAGGGGAGHR